MGRVFVNGIEQEKSGQSEQPYWDRMKRLEVEIEEVGGRIQAALEEERMTLEEYDDVCGERDRLKKERKKLREAIREAYEHTACAVAQSIASDDHVIVGHLRDASEILRVALAAKEK